MSDELHPFLNGAFVVASGAVAFFYWRYWSRTNERLFAILAAAFLMLAVERAVLGFFPPAYEGRHLIFLVRLLAFLAIIVGVVDKNWPRTWRVRRRAARREAEA